MILNRRRQDTMKMAGAVVSAGGDRQPRKTSLSLRVGKRKPDARFEVPGAEPETRFWPRVSAGFVVVF